MGTYFTALSTGRSRFWYISGKTSDEFYLDSARKTELGWLLYKELAGNGYERVVFYQTNRRFYCYDDASFARLTLKTIPAEPAKTAPGRGRGLRRGRWDDKRKNAPAAEAPVPAPEKRILLGEKSGVLAVPQENTPLHLGRHTPQEVFMQIEALLKNRRIRTAVVIDDADNFLNELVAPMSTRWNTLFNDAANLPAECTNIMVFVFPDEETGGISRMESLTNDTIRLKELNSFRISAPNALELCNMLHFFRLTKGLDIQVRELPETAREISRCMAKVVQDQTETDGMAHGVRTRQLYHLLDDFARTGERLTPRNCHKLFAAFGLKRIPTAAEQLRSLVGMKSVKQEIVGSFLGSEAAPRAWLEEMESNRIKPPKKSAEEMGLMHIALTGNPGTGKTTVAKILGQFFAERGYLRTGHVVETDRSGLVAGYVGQTAGRTMERVREALGGVLFIDEAYSLVPSSEQDFGQEAIDTLVKAMDQYKNDFIVVLAGYPEPMDELLRANPGLRSRIRKIIRIPDYEPEEIHMIVLREMNRRHLRFDDETAALMPDFCRNMVLAADETWGNAREAVKLAESVSEAVRADAGCRQENIDGVTWKIAGERHFSGKYRSFLHSAEEMRDAAREQIASMPGLAEVKRRLQILENGLMTGHQTEAGHYVFLGAPGTGKTTVARRMGAVFREYGILKRGHLVETNAQALSADFAGIGAKALGGILFIDEAYQLMRVTGGAAAVDSLVAFMENNRRDVCVILAGYEDEMNELLRMNAGLESRIHRLYFASYTGEELYQILVRMLENSTYSYTGEFLERSHRAVVRYAGRQERNPHFGNARWVREEYLKECVQALDERIVRAYGRRENIPEDLRNLLTGEDIPARFLPLTKAPLPKPDHRTVLEQIDGMTGFTAIKQRLHALYELAKFQQADESGGMPMPIRLNWVLKGNPGTGKTTVAALLGKVLHSCGLLPSERVVKATRADLVRGYVGQTAIQTRNMIEKAMGGVLFIDEAYALVPKNDTGADFGGEAIAELVEAMTDHIGEFAVVAAGYPADMDRFLASNSGLTGRFEEFILEDYTSQELTQIFCGMCRKSAFIPADALVAGLPGFWAAYKREKSHTGNWQNARECENLLREMQVKWQGNRTCIADENDHSRYLLTTEHLPDDLRRYFV